MFRSLLLAGTCLVAAGSVFAATSATSRPSSEAATEASFEAGIHPAEIGAWIKQMASEPNQVGSPHDKANAEFELAEFKKFGWDAHIETFQVLYPTPISEDVTMLGPKPYKLTLQEKPIPGDTSSTAKDYALPAYFAYQGDGDVTAPIVYVNYGMQDDYKTLERMGISVKGKIVIARYGAGWRGLKPQLAQEHGAIGCLVYSDPADDGYATAEVYPDGPGRPPQGIQRGSVEKMTVYPGDPLTPGVGATANAKRLTRETSPVILKIPALPISYGDAQVLLATMTGQVVPRAWRGALPITYKVGPSSQKVHLMVKSDWSLKPVYDVIAMVKGSEFPNQWVVRGNHHDGWVEGASDPLSGQSALLNEAQSIGNLMKTGWRPKRTIVYASWDGEEPGLLGSTEWAEEHAAELKQKAVIYINTDNNERGFFHAGGNHDFEHFVTSVASDLTDPETHVSLAARDRARIGVEASEPGAREEIKKMAKAAADPSKDVPIGALGSGSDYSAYLEHLGLPALDYGFGGEGNAGGVYHSRYDTYEEHSKYADPGFVYDAMLAKVTGLSVLRIADSDLPVQRAGDFADTVAGYLKEIEKLAGDKRKAQQTQAKLLAGNAYKLAADPTYPSAAPTALEPVPAIDFAPLDKAVAKLKSSAAAYDSALAAKGASLSPDAKKHLFSLMQTIDQTLVSDVGLPGRSWYRNLIYAPGSYTGYGAKTLPGVREAVEQQRWADANKYSTLTAGVLNAYSARLDEAAKVLNGG